jgi:chemosensory pili system protein ChpA (sensor histidine kinase/response regulator)
MLNRVLDGTHAASPAVIAMVDQAFYTLPQLHAALRGEGVVTADLDAIQALADRVAAGEEVFYTAPAFEAVDISAVADAIAGQIVVAEADAGTNAVAAEAAVADVDDDSLPASVDELLLEILDTEVTGHLATVDAWVAQARSAPAHVDDALLRSIHTMNGAFAMTEVPSITGAMAPAEGYVRRLLAARMDATPEGVEAIADLAAAIRRTMTALQSASPRVARCDALAARLLALRDSLPEATPLPEAPVAALAANADDYDSAETPVFADGDLTELDLSAYGDLAGDDLGPTPVTIGGTDAGADDTADAQDSSNESLLSMAEQFEAERLEAEREERAEAERAEAERLHAERVEAERAEAERIETERVETERLDAERREAARVEEEERLEYERLEAEYAEADRIVREQALEAERLDAARSEAERLVSEQTEAERLEAERLEAERLEAERLEAERLEAERLEAERLEAERLEAEQQRAALADEAAAAEPAAAVSEPAVAALLAGALASGEDPDAALDLTDLDPELIDIFVEEAGDLLDHSDGLLAQLRDAPGEREPLVGLQRDLHTLKGGARMAGIMAIGELGHAMESLLEAVVEQRSELGRDGVPLLERGFDRLHAMVTRVGARHAVGMPEALISEFDLRSRGAFAEASRPDTPQRASKVPVELKPLSAPINTALDGEEDDVGVRAPQEQVRIRADLLDRLVNYAGEVAIYRARLEQQLGAFRSAMAEMEQTNARLRDQLRRLDSETEAQIIARYQREHEVGDETFDPLELDRFSTLQQLSRGLAESAADMSSLQGTLDDLTSQYETLLLQQSRVSSDLQQGLMRTRMVPFDALVPRLRRVVRQAATETGKQVQLKLDGAQGELDRNVLERMTAPLEHMLRNAVAHGLESPEQRRKAKKPEEGTVRIAVRREGSEVVLEVSDDGGGLNRAAIRRRGEARGLVRADAILADADLDTLILEPGFSTADEVSRLAGRGVGMDVVASEVRQLGGALDIASRSGEGTTFTLRLPQTLAVTQAVFVRIGEASFAVPIASVRGVGRIAREDLDKPGGVYNYGGEEYALHDLGALVGHAAAKAEGQLQMPLLLIRSGDLRAAVSIDQVIGNREIVVKPVGPQVASVPGIFGATIMGDGSVVVILDIAPLVRRQAALPRDVEPAPAIEQRRVPLVMVVDDSVTMRKVTGRVLERHNFEVGTAKDGIDALERMAERVPDLMLLDIEMPRMDGYELATQMKADVRLRNVPIIMITSRTGDKHRQRAFQIGVERYLGKPYQEHELIRNVFDLLAIERAND